MRRWVALAMLVAAGPAASATFLEMSVEEVARSSDAVVRGRVVSQAARATRDGRIVTEVEIEVASAWRGAPARTVRVVVPGGSLGTVALKVDAAPTFEDGEDVVVFLARNGPKYSVSGYALGKYRVEGGEARPSLDGARVIRRALRAGERAVGPMQVEDLERRVRAAR